ncbi:MAG: tetratricopeptide repeat protein [Burkholderiales bacterium]
MKAQFFYILIAALFSSLVHAQSDTTLDRARALLAAKDSKAAFELLAPLEPQRAGQPDFDYLLGMAALDAGDAQAAIFALERVVTMQPGNLQARAELARAHFALGENDAAKREFESVRKGQIPPDVAASVDRFLSAIERGPTRFNAYVELTAGLDSNVNSATSSSSLAIPGLGTVLLGPGLTRDGDSYMGLGAGLNVVHPLTPTLAATGNLSFANKLNNSATTFDTANIDASGGLRLTRGNNVFSGALVGQTFMVDNNRFRNSVGAVGQWQHNYSETRQSSLFVQYTDLNYPGQPVRDAERWVVGAGYATALALPLNPVVFGSVYTGSEKERAQAVPHLGHTPLGVRVGGQVTWTSNWVLFASLGWEERKYGGQEPLFSETRKDNQTDLRIGANWRVAPLWLVTPQITYTDNRSNVALYGYSRTLASVTLRREF